MCFSSFIFSNQIQRLNFHVLIVQENKKHIRCSYEIVFLIFEKKQRVKLDDFSSFRLLIMFVTYTNGVTFLFTGKMSTVFLKGCFSEYSFFP